MSRRIQILRRAAELFERKGVTQTSIEDIATAVGVKREAVYYYFKSREDILLEIILPQSNNLIRNLRGALAGADTNLGKLHAAIEAHLSSYSPGYLETTVMLREKHFFKDDEKPNAIRQVWREYTDMWEKLIRDGQKTGEFNAELDPKVVAYGILGMCNWLARWYNPNKDLSIPDITENFFAMISGGIIVNPTALSASATRAAS
jgi:AcrR family transcriptional regulator